MISRSLAGKVAVVGIAFWILGRLAAIDPAPASEGDSQAGAQRHVNQTIGYKLVAINRTSDYIPKVSFFAIAPLSKLGAQTVESVKASHPYTVKNNGDTANAYEFSLENVAPYSSTEISISADVRFLDSAAIGNIDHLDRYIRSEPYIEVNDPALHKLTVSLTRESTLDTARAIYDWVANNVSYAGYIENELGAKFAFENRKGDCTEYAYLYTALARANGIPTRPLAGYVVGANGQLRNADFHNWAESFINDRWILVDPQKKVFDDNYTSYIATTVIDHTKSSDGLARFWSDDHRIKIAMK